MVLTCTAARPGARQKAEAIAALLPCVRMPQLNVHALVHGVEANALLMAQPVTCVRPRPGRCMRGAAGRACRCGASHGRHAKTRTCALERADLYRACRSLRRAGILRGASAAPQVLLCLAYRTITKAQLLARGLLQQAQLLERRPPAYAMRPHGPGPPPRPAAAAVASPPSDAASGVRDLTLASCAESARVELGEGVLPEQVQCRMQPLRHHAQGLSHHAGGCFICTASCTNIGLWQVCADSAGSGARGVMSLVH